VTKNIASGVDFEYKNRASCFERSDVTTAVSSIQATLRHIRRSA